MSAFPEAFCSKLEGHKSVLWQCHFLPLWEQPDFNLAMICTFMALRHCEEASPVLFVSFVVLNLMEKMETMRLMCFLKWEYKKHRLYLDL